MFKLHTNAKRIVKRMALLSCVTAIGALGAAGTSMANDVTAPLQKVHSFTEARLEWKPVVDDGVPVPRYELEESIGGDGVWNPVVFPVSRDAQSMVVSVDDGASHRFRVRAWNCPSLSPCEWFEARVARPWRYSQTFQRSVMETTISTSRATGVSTSASGWSVERLPDYSGGGTLKLLEGKLLGGVHATVTWGRGVYNIAPIGTKGPGRGKTTFTYTWRNNLGQSFSATHPPVTQTASDVSYRQPLDERRFLPGSLTSGRGITVRPYGGGYSDVDAIVLFQPPA